MGHLNKNRWSKASGFFYLIPPMLVLASAKSPVLISLVKRPTKAKAKLPPFWGGLGRGKNRTANLVEVRADTNQNDELFITFLNFFFLWPLPRFLQRRNEVGENQKGLGLWHKMG
jgi:hypothetical protein